MFLSRSLNRNFRLALHPRRGLRFFSSTSTEVSEGAARMLHGELDPVFFNSIQGINRDLSIQVIKLFSEIREDERRERQIARNAAKLSNELSEKNTDSQPPDGITVLDALTATGFRSVRYLQEIPKIKSIVMNDVSSKATEMALKTVLYNDLDLNSVVIQNKDANSLMHSCKKYSELFDVIDIDPYGSSAPFLDAAMQAVSSEGGLLCLTCTDYATLCGVHSGTSLARYGTMNFPTGCMSEVALRTLLHAVDSAANRQGKYIVPWLSLSIDYYVRVFVRVYKSPLEVKKSPLKRAMLYQSRESPSFHVHPLGRICQITNKVLVNNAAQVPAQCPQTGAPWKLGGPFWAGPLHEQTVVDELLSRVKNSYSLDKHKEKKNDYGDKMSSSSTSMMSQSLYGAAPLKPPSSNNVVFTIPTAKRLMGVLSSMSEELKDVLFFYNLPEMSTALQCKTPSHVTFKSALLNAGYRVSHFHHDANAIKTDAPDSVMWDIMREFAFQEQTKIDSAIELTAKAAAIRSVSSSFRPNFRFNRNALPSSEVSRFVKGGDNWGPQAKAKF